MDNFKKDVPIITNSFKNFADSISYIDLNLVKQSGSWVNYAKSIGNTDKELLKFLSDVDSEKCDISDIDNYMNQASSSTAKFGATLKTVATNMAIAFAISKGIELIVIAIDNWIHKVDKLKESTDSAIDELEAVSSKSDSLNLEFKTTNERITELENKPNLTFIEQEELEKLKDSSKELERQIELHKTLLSVQEGKTRDSALKYLNAKGSYEKYGE